MSTVGSIVRIAKGVAGKAAHAVTHPRETATTVTEQARGLAGTVTGGERQPDVPPAGGPDRHVEPAEPVRPVRPVEPSTTEPKAASREGAHHGRGAEPSDDWHDELDDAPDVGTNPATGRPNNRPGADGPLIDPSDAKAVRSESETMSRASDPDKDH